MFRSIKQSSSSAKFNSTDNKLLEGEKQKQKKRLSFKDPEVEKPPAPEPRALIHTGHAISHSREHKDYFAEAGNFQDLYPPDQESRQIRDRSRSPDPRIRNLDQSKAAAAKDGELPSDENDSKSKPTSRQKLLLSSPTERDYLEILSPPKPEAAAMKCPVIEFIGEEEDEGAASTSVKKLERSEANMPTSARHQIQLLNYHLEQQRQQTQTAMYQIQLLKDQLEAESAARYKAQVHNHQLMLKNKELLDHIQNLFHQVQDLEKKIEKLEKDFAMNHESRSVQSYSDSYGRPQLSYRRNSGSTQSLWSTPSLLTPPPYTPSRDRRGSATSLGAEAAATNAEQQSSIDQQQAEDTRKQQVISKTDNTYKYTSPFAESDWRSKRRGSSGNYNTLDFSRIRSSSSSGVEPGGTDKYAMASRNQSQITDSKQQQQPTTYGQRRSESVSGLDRAMSRKTIAIDDSLMIADSANLADDFGATGFQGSSSSRTEQTKSSAVNCSDQMTRESISRSSRVTSTKKGFGSYNLKENHDKLAQSLETLRLFNS